MMQPIASGAAARPFSTHHNALDIDLFMRIAPELYLKRLIVGGLSRVYEINRNFRNEGISTQHNPEFTMLEFYEAYADYNDLIARTEELFSGLAHEVLGTDNVQFRGNEISFARPFARFTMKEAIAEFGGDRHARARRSRQAREPGHRALEDFHPKADGTHGPSDTPHQKIASMNSGKLIAELFEAVAEHAADQADLHHRFSDRGFAAVEAARAMIRDYVERFELYIGGMEVANAFSELNDADEQDRRFRQQLGERERGDDEAHADGRGLRPRPRIRHAADRPAKASASTA